MREDFVVVPNQADLSEGQVSVLKLPYLETDDSEFMRVMHLEEFIKHHEKESFITGAKLANNGAIRLSAVESEVAKRLQLFTEYQNALMLFVDRAKAYPEGLFIFSITNLVYFYNDVISQLFSVDERKVLYPNMGFLLAQALLLNFASNELSARHFILDEDRAKYRNYLNFLKTEELSNLKKSLEFNRETKIIETQSHDLMNTILTIILRDAKAIDKVQSNAAYKKAELASGKPVRVAHPNGQVEIHTIYGGLQDIAHYIVSVQEAMKYSAVQQRQNRLQAFGIGFARFDGISDLLGSSSVSPFLPPDQIARSVSQSHFDGWLRQSGRYKPMIPTNISDTINLLSIISSELEGKENAFDYSALIATKLDKLFELYHNIIAIYARDQKIVERICLQGDKGGFQGFFQRYALRFHGFGDQLTGLLNRLFEIANTPDLRAKLAYTLLGYFDEPDANTSNPGFVAYHENIKLVLQVIINHDPLYCLVSTEYSITVESLLHKLGYREIQASLYQGLIFNYESFNYPIYLPRISYKTIQPGSDNYKRIIATEPKMQSVLHNILLAKICADFGDLTKLGRDRLSNIFANILITETDSLLREIAKRVEDKKFEPENLKKYFIGREVNEGGKAKTKYDQFNQTILFQLLKQKSQEVISLAIRFLPKDKWRDFYLQQTYLYLLDSQRYSELDLLNSEDVLSGKVLEITKVHIGGLDKYSLAKLKAECSNQVIQELIDRQQEFLATRKEELSAFDTLKSEAQELRNAVSALTSKAEVAETKAANQKQQIIALEGRVNQLKKIITESEVRAKQLEDDKAVLAESIQASEAKFDEATESFEKDKQLLEARLKEAQSELSNYATKLGKKKDFDQQKQRLLERIKALTQENEELLAQSSGTEVVRLNHQVSQLSDKLKKISLSNGQTISELKRERDELIAKEKNLIKQITELRKKSSVQNSEIEMKLKAEAERLIQEQQLVAQLKAAIVVLNAEKEQAEVAKTKALSDVTAVREELTRLQQKDKLHAAESEKSDIEEQAALITTLRRQVADLSNSRTNGSASTQRLASVNLDQRFNEFWQNAILANPQFRVVYYDKHNGGARLYSENRAILNVFLGLYGSAVNAGVETPPDGSFNIFIPNMDLLYNFLAEKYKTKDEHKSSSELVEEFNQQLSIAANAYSDGYHNATRGFQQQYQSALGYY